MATNQLDALARDLAACKSLVVITGAGVSAESGISTFRGAGGYWNRYKAEELASPEGFARDPALVWRWYDERRRQIAAAEPNPGHRAIAELEKLFSSFTLITQNVDGLHQRAGSQRQLEIHGSIWRVRCIRSGQEWVNRAAFESFPVKCACGALLRPAVLWFGEMYDRSLMQQAQRVMEEAEAVLVVGTSGQVWIVAGLLAAAREAATGGLPEPLIAEFNLAATDTGAQADYLILGPAGQKLPQLLEKLRFYRAQAMPFSD